MQRDLRRSATGRMQPVANGIDFLGYVLRPDYRLVRQRVVAHLHEKLEHLERQMSGPAQAQASVSGALQNWRLPPDAQPLLSMLASYLGHFRHANSERLVASLWRRYPWLHWLVKRTATGKLLRLDAAPGVASMRGQWRYFRRVFGPACVVMQVGNRVEIYGDDARRVAQWRGHGGTPVARVAWAPGESGLSWPLARRTQLLQGLTQRGLAWVDVAQRGWLKGGIRQRALRALHMSGTADARPVKASQIFNKGAK